MALVRGVARRHDFYRFVKLWDGSVVVPSSALADANVLALSLDADSAASSDGRAVLRSTGKQTAGTTGNLQAVAGYLESTNAVDTTVSVMNPMNGIHEHSGAGTVTQARGGDFRVFLSGNGTIGEAAAVNARLVKTGGGTITNGYGLKVEDVTQASTNYAIHTGVGIVHHGGPVETAATEESTGANMVILGNNSPAGVGSAPYTWIQALTSDGSTVYVPVWK